MQPLARSPLRNTQNLSKIKEDCRNNVTLSSSAYGDGLHPPPPLSSSSSTTVSVSTQYDPLLESMSSYRQRYRSCRCHCGGVKADSDEEDDDVNSNNPWNVSTTDSK